MVCLRRKRKGSVRGCDKDIKTTTTGSMSKIHTKGDTECTGREGGGADRSRSKHGCLDGKFD